MWTHKAEIWTRKVKSIFRVIDLPNVTSISTSFNTQVNKFDVQVSYYLSVVWHKTTSLRNPVKMKLITIVCKISLNYFTVFFLLHGRTSCLLATDQSA